MILSLQSDNIKTTSLKMYLNEKKINKRIWELNKFLKIEKSEKIKKIRAKIIKKKYLL